MTALGPVSAALGAAQRTYAVRVSADGILGSSPPQGMRFVFTRSGVAIGAVDQTVVVGLRGYGSGSLPLPLAPAEPVAAGNRVTYLHPGVAEWYANGPLGLEQGFVLQRPAPGIPRDTATLQLSLRGALDASLIGGGTGLRLSRDGKPVLTYAGLAAADAAGRPLATRLELRPGGVAIRVEIRGARYPVRIDPLFQQSGKLTGQGEAAPSDFGGSVAISRDGNTALVGGPYDNNDAGAAWVFTRSGSVWTQQGPKLTPGDETGAGLFGTSVALSLDGNTALIGGPNDNAGAGAGFVFVRTGSSWSEQGTKLTGAGASGTATQGVSVALSDDGNTAAIGGSNDNTARGAVWVFVRTGNTWAPQGAKLVGPGVGSQDHSGQSVALSADGNTLLVGGPGGSNVQPIAGKAWVFLRTTGTWAPQGAALIGNCTSSCSGPSGTGETGKGSFGSAVALSADGNTALIGAATDNANAGAAWVFTRSAGAWSQQGGPLTAGDEAGAAQLGSSVSLSTDGSTALIGGPGDKARAGAVWLFAQNAGTWAQQGSKLTASDASSTAAFGSSVALSGDALRAIIAGNEDSGAGAIWAFGPALPTARITAPAGRVFARGTTVLTRFSCSPPAGAQPIAVCRDSRGAHAPGGRLDTSKLGLHTYSVTATTADGQVSTTTIQYLVVLPPSISIRSPANRASYAFGQKVKALYTCTDSRGAPGIASCAGPVRSGSSIKTTKAGRFTFTVTARSRDGGVTRASVSYTVRPRKKPHR